MEEDKLRHKARRKAIDRLMDVLLPPTTVWRSLPAEPSEKEAEVRRSLENGALDDYEVELELSESAAATTPPASEEPEAQLVIDRLFEGTVPIEPILWSHDDPDALCRALEAQLRELPRPRAPIREKVSQALDRFTREEYEELRALSAEVEQHIELPIPERRIAVAQASLLDLLRRHPELVHEISHREFEEVLFDLFGRMGFEVELTARTRDGGCDLIAFADDQIGMRTRYIIEAKHYRPENKVGVAFIRQLSAVRQKHGAHHGILVTSSSFTKDALEENRTYYGLHLRDYARLRDWINQF